MLFSKSLLGIIQETPFLKNPGFACKNKSPCSGISNRQGAQCRHPGGAGLDQASPLLQSPLLQLQRRRCVLPARGTPLAGARDSDSVESALLASSRGSLMVLVPGPHLADAGPGGGRQRPAGMLPRETDRVQTQGRQRLRIRRRDADARPGG